jgi:nucleotide-binding universal stress UspA family protein
MKKSILVPVDFTKNAHNAYAYATHLAHKFDCSIHLVHVYSGIDKASGDRKKAEEKHSRILADLKSFQTFYSLQNNDLPFAPVDTTFELRGGDIIKEINNLSVGEQVEMIVAGTRDKHSLGDKWLGTISQGISMKAQCPVLLVPKGVKYSDFKHIVFACDYMASNFFILDRIQSFNRSFHANIHFVHVEQNQDDAYGQVKNEIFDFLMAYEEPSFGVHMSSIQGGNVGNTLFEYAHHHGANLIVLVSKHRSFFEKIIHKSMTKRIVLRSHIPVLVMHIDD